MKQVSNFCSFTAMLWHEKNSMNRSNIAMEVIGHMDPDDEYGGWHASVKMVGALAWLSAIYVNYYVVTFLSPTSNLDLVLISSIWVPCNPNNTWIVFPFTLLFSINHCVHHKCLSCLSNWISWMIELLLACYEASNYKKKTEGKQNHFTPACLSSWCCL